MPTLYLVATPIGNLEDLTLRARRILGEVPLIAAEDTRKTRLLLRTYGLRTPLTSYYEGNQKSKLPRLLRHLEEKDLALVSEAGMPGLSDPGYELVRAASERAVKVVPIPGASALVAALAASGLPSHQFLYLGFLPRRPGERRRLLRSVAEEPRTLVAFEAPHRFRATLQDIQAVLGERPLAVCRELTKIHEEIFRGIPSQALAHFSEPRGEFTLVVTGAEKEKPQSSPSLEEELRLLREQGLSARDAVARLSQERGLPRKVVYQAWLRLR